MDNRIFNVNGAGADLLAEVLAIAFTQSGMGKAKSWRFVPDKGFVLYWAEVEHAHKLPSSMGPQSLAPMIREWLSSDEAESMACEGYDANPNDSDVETEFGWRVYVEDWGHVGGNHAAICAVRPAYMWYGK